MLWSDFKAAVRVNMTSYASIQGIQSWIDSLIVGGAVDIQKSISEYQGGHEQVLAATDLVSDGYAMRGTVPNGHWTGARVVKWDLTENALDRSNYNVCHQVSWRMAHDMRSGLVDDGITRLAVEPMRGQFLITPPLNDETRLVLEWEGVKRSFADNDETKFDEEVALAVADYVLQFVVRRVDHDINEAATYGRSYMIAKRKLLSAAVERGLLARQNASMATSATPTETTSGGGSGGGGTVTGNEFETFGGEIFTTFGGENMEKFS